jgi:hypothetical protein
MQLALKYLAFSLVTMTAASAFAEQSRVSVPFNFVAKARTFPAGVYEISLDLNQSFITLANEADSAKSFRVGVGPADKAHAETVLEFNVVGKDHFLKTIQVGPRISSKLSLPDKPNSGAQYSVGTK